MLAIGCVLPDSTAKSQQNNPSERDGTGETPDIIWAIDAIPPIFYENDGMLTGFGMSAINWLLERMPELDIAIDILPRGRAHEFMRHSLETGVDALCVPGLLETPERADDFVFSNTVFPVLPVSVIIEANREEEFASFLTEDGKVSLPLLLLQSALSPAIETGRSYGPIVDPMLAAHKSRTHVQTTGQSADFAQMLALGRIDWFMAYPMEASFLASHSTAAANIKSLQIDGMPDMLNGKFACSPTPTGRDIIARINAEVAKTPDLPWMAGYIDVLAPEDALRYQKMRQVVY